MKEFNREIALDVSKDLTDIGFKFNSVWYDAKHFGNFGFSLTLIDDKPITISMLRDRMYLECRITKEQFLIKENGKLDYYHFFPENVFVDDLLAAIGIKTPRNGVRQNNDDEILLAMKNYSKLISANIEPIKKSLKSNNILETKKGIEIAAKKREEEWGKELARNGYL